MTTKCITTCDGCGTRIEEANPHIADYGFMLSSYYVRAGGDDPLPARKTFLPLQVSCDLCCARQTRPTLNGRITLMPYGTLMIITTLAILWLTGCTVPFKF